MLCFPAVWIFSDKRAYATETDIKCVAVTEQPDPVYFHWKFGDGPEKTTTSRIYKKRYRLPDKYFFFIYFRTYHSQTKELPIILRSQYFTCLEVFSYFFIYYLFINII